MKLASIHDEYIQGKTADALRESEQFFNQEIINNLWPDGSHWPVSVPPRDHAEAVATIEVKAVLLASLHKQPMDSIVWTDRRLTALAADLPVLISAGYAPMWQLMATYGCLDPMAQVLATLGFVSTQSVVSELSTEMKACVLPQLPAYIALALRASGCDTTPLADCLAGAEPPVLSAIWQLNWGDHERWFSQVQSVVQSIVNATPPPDWPVAFRAYRMTVCVLWLADYREPLLQRFATQWMQMPQSTSMKPWLDQLLWRDRQWLISYLYRRANQGAVETREQAWPLHKQLCDWYTN
ncbi:MAG: hypothetical protein P8L47_03215 [Candidatus Marinamargulisbacteria bacterium]|nr:hypothetical protein [Candidatus Marinamargulisbacteria bacterium]